MTEAEKTLEIKERELIRSQACLRLDKNSDFLVFRELLNSKLTEYRNLLEENEESSRSNIVRGGILALKDVLSLFDAVKMREESLIEEIKELKNA